MLPTSPFKPTARRRRRRLAVAALCGLALVATSVSAHAAPPASSNTSGSSWLPLDIEASPLTDLKKAGLPGGGWWIGLHERPGADGTATSATVTLNVGEEALATAAATNDDGVMVPTKSQKIEGLESETSGGETVLTLTSTATDQQFFILPRKAPDAADPEDQGALSRAWDAVVNFLTGDDEAEEEGDEEEGDEEEGDDADGRSPEAGATEQPIAEPSTPAVDDEVTDSEESPDPTATAEEDGSRADDSTTCVISESHTEDESTGQQLQAGPNSAPTFSEQTRREALAAAGCTPDGTSTDDEDSESDDDQHEETTAAGGTGDSAAKLGLKEGDWFSGASGELDRRQALEQARGADMEIATTWQHGHSAAISLDVLKDGGEYSKANWTNKALILSVSPFPDGDGSWEAAASGDYTAKWAEQARNAKAGWGTDRGAPLIASVAWELNGNWFKWSATKEQTGDVKTALDLWAQTWQEEFPDAYRILTYNFNSNGYDGNSLDLWPGQRFEGLGWDGYNHYPHVSTEEEFAANYMSRDGGGGPQGPGAWLAALTTLGEENDQDITGWMPEWNNNPSQGGESTAYMEGIHDMLAENAGPGAGQIAGEVVFITDIDNGNWNLGSGTKMPETAKAYNKLFADVGSGTSSRPTRSVEESSDDTAEGTPSDRSEPSDADSEDADDSGERSPATARAAGTSTSPVTIMAVGDSIIDNGSGGVREPLQKMLATDGLETDWVGPNSGGPSDLADKDHAAKSGVLVKELKDDVGAWAAEYEPDIVYVDAGRNDVMWGNSAGVATDYASLIAAICTTDPDVTILAALQHEMGPGARDSGNEKAQEQLNPAIKQVATKARGGGCDVQVVDLSGVITQELRSDDVHPSVDGFQAEAEVIYPLLTEAINAAA